MIEEQAFVLDGDTVRTPEGQRRRLFGIDTPETAHNDEQLNIAGAPAATEQLSKLLTENPDAQWESMGTDFYGRELGRYVTQDGRDLNESLVRSGHADPLDFGDTRSPYNGARSEYVRDLEQGKDVFTRGGVFVPPERKKNRTLTQEFGEAVQRGVDQTQGLLGYGISAMARSIGMDSLSDYGEEVAKKNFAEAQAHAASVGSYKDITFEDGVLDGLEKTARFVIGLVGEQVPSIGIDLATAAATGGLGLAATAVIKRGLIEGAASEAFKKFGKVGLLGSMTSQQIGEVESELRQNGIDSPNTAIIGGLLGGLLDYTGARILMKSAGDLAKKGKWKQSREVIRQGLRNTALEGTTEALQEMTAKGAVLFHDSSFDMFSDDNIEAYVNAFIGGAVIGSAPSAAAAGASVIRKGFTKLSGSTIESQNQEALGITQPQSEAISESPVNTPTVTTTATNKEGEAVEIGQEVAAESKVEEVKAKLHSRAKKAGFTNITAVVAPAEEVVTQRVEDGLPLTANKDHVQEPFEQVESQFKALRDGGRTSVLTDVGTVRDLANRFPKSFNQPDMFVVTTQDQRAFIVKGKDKAEAVAVATQESQSEIHEAGKFSDAFHERQESFEENGLQEVDFVADEDLSSSGITQAETAQDNAEEAAEFKAQDAVEGEADVDTTTIKDSDDLEADVASAEAGFDKEQFAKDVAKNKIIIKGVTKFATDNGLNPKELAKQLEKAIAEKTIKGTDKDAIISTLNEYYAEVGSAKVAGQAVMEKKKEVDKIKADPFKNSAFAEALAGEELDTDTTEDAASMEALDSDVEGFSVTEPTEKVISKFWQDSAVDNPAIEDPENLIFYTAMEEGMSAAQAILRKRAIRDAKESDFEALGFSSQEELGRAKAVAKRSNTWGGAKGEDVSESMVFFRQGGTVYPVYLPAAMVELNKSDFRFSTTANERNFDARMQDQMAELLGFMAGNDYIPLAFPTAKDTKIHIAYRPSVRGGTKPLVMAELTQRAIRNATKSRTDFSTPEFMEAQQAQERMDASIALDKAIDKAISAAQGDDPLVTKATTERAIFLANRYETLVDRQQDALEEFESRIAQDIEADRVAPQVADPTRTEGGRAPSTGSRKKAKKPSQGSKVDAKKPATFVESVREYIDDLFEEISPKSSVTVKFDSTLDQVANVDINEGAVTVRLNQAKLKELNNQSPEAVKFVLAHEVGHVFVAETMDSIPADVLSVLHNDFKRDRARKPAGHPYRKRQGVGFDEWLSDQFATYIQNPEQKGNTFLERLRRMIAKIADSLAPMFGVGRVSTSRSGRQFMASIFRSGVFDKTIANTEFASLLASMNSEFGGNRPQTIAQERRYSVEQKALGRKIDPKITVKANRDFTLGQNLNQTSDLGRAAINAMGTGLTKTAKAVRSMLTDPSYIPSKATKFYDFARKGAPMFFTTANELKGMKGGRRIANMYRRMFDRTTADSALWQTETQYAFNATKEADLKAFIQGTGPIPSAISNLLTKFHKKLKRDMPTLGNVADFFPRAYDTKFIEQNRPAFERFLVAQAISKNVPAFSLDNAKEATDAILQDRGATIGVPDAVVPVFGNDPFSQKTRVLDFLDDAEMRKQKFLRSDVGDVLLGYVHRMSRRANFEREFSGWSPLVKRDAETKTEKKANAKFTRNLFISLPFRRPDGRLMTDVEKFETFGKADENFFQQNKVFFKQAVKNGWIREVGEGGTKAWEYYDKNKELRETYDALGNDNDRHRYVKIVDAMEGRTGADDLSPKVRDAMSTVVAYQNWLTLMFSGFSQLIEVSGVIFRNRDIEGAMDSLKEVGKLIMGQGAAERRALFNDLGFAQKQLTQQALLESMGVNYQSATAQKMNNLLFKVNGMNSVTNASRVLGAAVAERFIQRHARKAANGNPRSQRYLSELGITMEQANYANSTSYRPYNEFVRDGDLTSPEALKAEAIHKAMFKFVDSAIVRPNASQRPVWGSDPRWMLIWHLKSFMYAYGSSILGGLNTEIQSRYAETRKSSGSTVKAIGDASIPLMTYTIPVLLMSGLALELREFIQYTVLGLGAKPYSDSLYGSDYMMELVSRGGMMGPLEMGYSIADDVVANERTSLMGWISPTTSHLETILSFDADRIVNRSIPFVSQNPAMKQWFRELLN